MKETYKHEPPPKLYSGGELHSPIHCQVSSNSRHLLQIIGHLIVLIIVKHLPGLFTAEALEDFIKPALKGGLFQKKAELKAIKIVAMVNKKGVFVERHALVRITPDSEKARIIKALNNKKIGLHKFAVAEYVIRHWSNDRRDANHFPERQPYNRRSNDRRRNGLKMFTISEKLDF